ncbi:unnamed protein product, partial [Prorocentrum cordatum]
MLGRSASCSKSGFSPGMWLHQQLAYEFATECSESQAVALLERSGAAQDGPRSSKRQRQKLRRRLAAEEAAAAEEPQRQARPPSQEAPTVGAEAGPALPIARERVPPGESATELLSADPPEEHRAELRSGDGDALHPVGRGGLDQLQPREGSLDPRTPHHAFSPAVLSETPGSVHDDCDALTEISSATGLRTSRSNSVAGGYGVSSLSRTHLKHMAMLERTARAAGGGGAPRALRRRLARRQPPGVPAAEPRPLRRGGGVGPHLAVLRARLPRRGVPVSRRARVPVRAPLRLPLAEPEDHAAAVGGLPRGRRGEAAGPVGGRHLRRDALADEGTGEDGDRARDVEGEGGG